MARNPPEAWFPSLGASVRSGDSTASTLSVVLSSNPEFASWPRMRGRSKQQSMARRPTIRMSGILMLRGRWDLDASRRLDRLGQAGQRLRRLRGRGVVGSPEAAEDFDNHRVHLGSGSV